MATKADTTLVQAAFKEGQTRFAQPNMKPIFDATAAIQKTYADTLGNIPMLQGLDEDEKANAQRLLLGRIKSIHDSIGLNFIDNTEYKYWIFFSL